MLFLGGFVRGKDDEIRKFSEKFSITFPVGQENGMAEALGVGSIPTTVFISRDGSIAKKYQGAIEYDELAESIRAILKK